MIKFINPYETNAVNQDKSMFENQLMFKIKDSTFTIHQNTNNKIYKKILKYISQNPSGEILLLNSTDEISTNNSKSNYINIQKNDQKILNQSDDYSDDPDLDIPQYDEYDDQFNKKYIKEKTPNIFKSNYDQQGDLQYFDIVLDDDSISGKEYYDKVENYYNNRLDNCNFLFPLRRDTAEKNKKMIFEKQFQLILDGYDIIIPDFLVDYMLFIAEILDLNELKEAILPLQEQINDTNNYNDISELKMLMEVEDILMTINESNKDDKLSTIFSLYLYIGCELFKSMLEYFVIFLPNKKQIFYDITKMIGKRYGKFTLCFNVEKKVKTYHNEDYDILHPYHKMGQVLQQLIEIDDVDSLQKALTDFNLNLYYIKVKLEEKNPFHKYIDLSSCNLLEYSAFLGSIKCFKFLMLNTSLECKACFAVKGGNSEIIHILDQNHCNFNDCVEFSIYFHQNDIGQWLIDNRKANIDLQKGIDICIDHYNFNFLSYILDVSFSISNEFQNKFIFHANEKFQIFKNLPQIPSYFLFYPNTHAAYQKIDFLFHNLFLSNEKEINSVYFYLLLISFILL